MADPRESERLDAMPDDTTEPRTRGAGHIAIGYTDRRVLDEYLTEEAGDIVVRGPIRVGAETRDVAAMRSNLTEATPCLVVPLVYERIDEIRHEIDSVLDRFGTGPTGERVEESGVDGDIHDRARHDAEHLRAQPEPQTIDETGGETRGAGPGAYRTGSDLTETPEDRPADQLAAERDEPLDEPVYEDPDEPHTDEGPAFLDEHYEAHRDEIMDEDYD